MSLVTTVKRSETLNGKAEHEVGLHGQLGAGACLRVRPGHPDADKAVRVPTAPAILLTTRRPSVIPGGLQATRRPGKCASRCQAVSEP